MRRPVGNPRYVSLSPFRRAEDASQSLFCSVFATVRSAFEGSALMSLVARGGVEIDENYRGISISSSRVIDEQKR